MNDFQMNRRQALIVGGLGTLSLGMPGAVMGSDELDAQGNAKASDKSCIFVLLCGGPSHVDTWDMKPDAPASIRGPYKPIDTKVPGMRINEMHTRLPLGRLYADEGGGASGPWCDRWREQAARFTREGAGEGRTKKRQEPPCDGGA